MNSSLPFRASLRLLHVPLHIIAWVTAAHLVALLAFLATERGRLLETAQAQIAQAAASLHAGHSPAAQPPISDSRLQISEVKP